MNENSEKEISSPEKLGLKKKSSSVNLCAQDFILNHKLGKGAYGDVYLVSKKSDGKLFAMKQILKKKLQKQRKQYQALVEKELLTVMKHVGVVKLRYAFQDKKILYFILQYCEGGQFIQFIRLNLHQLTQPVKVFYIAEIVNILQYLHTNGITHRDIKPENMLLDNKGHLKLIDFGTAEITNCKIVSNQFKQKIMKLKDKSEEQQQPQFDEDDFEPKSPGLMIRERKSTFVGTCYYISPELLEQNQCNPAADLWALGCILYQLYYLETPFKDNYEFAVFQKIKKAEVHFAKNDSITDDAIDLIKKLLVKNPNQRLGSGTTEELTFQKLKKHPFFKGINVDDVFDMNIPEISEMKEPEIYKEEQDKLQEKLIKSKSDIESIMKKQLVGKTDILIHGIVQKKTFITYSCYYLIVYENLNIVRIKADEPEKKKEFHLKPNDHVLPAKILGENKFELITVEKVYSFKSQNAENWVKVINSAYCIKYQK